jgi:deoxyhypusine synthase
MIRQDKVQIISCTCKFRRRYLICLLNSWNSWFDSEQEWVYLKRVKSVTDTCIPEHEAFRRLQKHIYKIWKTQMMQENVIYHMSLCTKCFIRRFRRILRNRFEDSWMYAAAEKLTNYL